MHLTFLSTVTGAEQAALKEWNRISVLYVMRIILPFCVQAHAFLSEAKYEFERQPISTWRKIACYCSVRAFTLI